MLTQCEKLYLPENLPFVTENRRFGNTITLFYIFVIQLTSYNLVIKDVVSNKIHWSLKIYIYL